MTTFRTSSLTAVVSDGQYGTVSTYRLLANAPVINGEAFPVIPGTPVTLVGDSTVMQSSAANTGRASVDGIVWNGNGPTLNMMLRTSGLLELASTAAWDLVTGDVGGLVPGATYYLGSTPGTLTTTPPDSSQVGKSVTVIGKAHSPKALFVEIRPPVLL